MLMGLLNAQGYSVSHTHIMLLETTLANAVVKNTRIFYGLYVPPFLKKGNFVFFAADNTNFARDIAYGKETIHGTITTVYQKTDAPGKLIAPPLTIDDSQSLSVIPDPNCNQWREQKSLSSTRQASQDHSWHSMDGLWFLLCPGRKKILSRFQVGHATTHCCL